MGEQKTVRFNFTLDENIKDYFDDLSKRKGVSTSSMMNIALSEWMDVQDTREQIEKKFIMEFMKIDVMNNTDTQEKIKKYINLWNEMDKELLEGK